MCRRVALGAAAVAVALALQALPGATQESTTPRVPVAPPGSAEERLTQRLDSLRALVDAAREAWNHAAAVRDSLDRLAGTERLDTVVVGPLTVVARTDQIGEASRVVGTAWAELADLAGPLPPLEGRVLFFDHAGGRRPDGLEGEVFAVTAPSWVPGARMEGNARVAVGRMLASVLGPHLSTWTGAWSVGTPARPGRIYRELASLPGALGKRCLTGTAEACWMGLGLGEGGGSPWAWYTPEEQVALVRHYHAVWSRERYWYRPAEDGGLAERCAAEAPDGHLEACSAFLGRYQALLPRPLGHAARQALMWIALEAGGPGAFQRLADPSHGDPVEALVAASGMSPEELSEAWLRWVLANRPEVYGSLGATSGVAAFWFLFLSLLALRSTRWRSA